MDFRFLYLDPKGRISRKTWWLGAIGLLILAIIANMVLSTVGAVIGLNKSAFGVGLLSLLSLAIFFVPYYSLTVKRLHDRSRPTMLFWAFIGPSILSALLMMMGVSGSMGTVEMFGQQAPAFRPNAVGGAVGFLGLAVGLWALVELGFLKGDAGANDYGPDPLAQSR